MGISKKVLAYRDRIRKDTLSKDELRDLIKLLHELYEGNDAVWNEKVKEQFLDFYSEEDEIYDNL